MTEPVRNVLFLCTGNSARSILAEALTGQLGQGAFKGYSAGSFPKGEVNPLALKLLREQGLPTAHLRSKSWDEFARPGAPTMDYVFTVCDQAAGEVCPIWPGHPVTAHWGIPDPAAAEGTEAERMLAFREAFRMLERRIRLFLALQHKALGPIDMQREVAAIGRLDARRGASIMSVTIYHNPDCGTSRNVLGLIRNSGEEPTVIEYLKTPPSRDELVSLIQRMGIPVRDLLRRKGTPYEALGLDDPKWTDDQLIDLMLKHPILINRPIVVTPKGVKLCRPSETVLDLLLPPQRGAFAKEDGELVVDEHGDRVSGMAR